MLNKLCTRPVAISGVLGAYALDLALIMILMDVITLPAIVADRWFLLYSPIAFISSTLLGIIIGMAIFWPLVRVICSKINGAPLRPGDRVMILSGLYKNSVAVVSGKIKGQGGWELAILNFGSEQNGQTGVYEEYELLWIGRTESD